MSSVNLVTAIHDQRGNIFLTLATCVDYSKDANNFFLSSTCYEKGKEKNAQRKLHT